MKLTTKILRKISITIQETPNPTFLKFVPQNSIISNLKSVEFIKKDDCQNVSSLAKQIFEIENVNRVFFGFNYISVSLENEDQWKVSKPIVEQTISDYMDNKLPIFEEKYLLDMQQQSNNENDSEVVQFIKEIINTRVKAIVHDDGGDVEFKSFDESTGTVTLIMKGSCAGCPSSAKTLKDGIQRMLQYYIGEVENVIAFDNQ